MGEADQLPIDGRLGAPPKRFTVLLGDPAMDGFDITPKVDETQEFIEIANDFSNPLDLVREAISNSCDAGASEMSILFDVVPSHGEQELRITIVDDGSGMDVGGLQSFFDLGNSLRRDDPAKIGEKGHGTKVYFHSRRLEVSTDDGANAFHATMDQPFRTLHERRVPTAAVIERPSSGKAGTRITIMGYNNNRRERFTHDILRDHIRWFTKFGSMEVEFGHSGVALQGLLLKGLDRDVPERLEFGHIFPDESINISNLFDEHLVRAPEYYCKRVKRSGALDSHPEVRYQAVFSIEGNRVKQAYNNMLRRQGYQAPKGSYTVQERYGLWLCRDFIAVQRRNDWITSRGSEYTRFHAFFNCQSFKLTANRGSVDNTPSELLEDVHRTVNRLYEEIVQGDDWRQLTWLEQEAAGHHTAEKERKDFDFRVTKAQRSNVAQLDGVSLVEPNRESGVYGLFVQLATLKPQLFPFQIVDYDTHEGLDVIAKGDKSTAVSKARLYYVEFKYILDSNFNHSFDNLHSVVCWDCRLKHEDVVKDIADNERRLAIVEPGNEGDYTRYYLDAARKAHKIEVFVLKDYLKQRLGLEFRPRTAESTS